MMVLGIPAVSGFWPDYYACTEDNIIETINRMLYSNADDFPSTCCVGFTVIRSVGGVRIYPRVKNKEFTYDFYMQEKI